MTAMLLLADLAQRGIEVVAHNDCLRYRPRSALTPDLLTLMDTHKPELLAILSSGDLATAVEHSPRNERSQRVVQQPDVDHVARRCDDTEETTEAPESLTKQPSANAAEVVQEFQCRRCSSTRRNDVSIHKGQTIRRDCGTCGRFHDFPVWYGKTTAGNIN